ncbi:MAG: efflux RND transporter periplasmic adaptor subunit [Tepidisphaeraceae bacterium]|jgi:RND family efflux transporter MFP subunit
MKKFRIVILIVIVLAVVGGIYYATERQSREIVLTGIVATDEVIISPQISGLLQQLMVKEGDTVTKGELLGQIDPKEMQADLDYYISSEKQFAAAVVEAQADLENARLTYERDEPLYRQQAISAQDYDSARTAYDAAKAHVDSLDLQVQAAKAQEEKALVELGYTKIFSPLDATVDTRTALEGEVLNVAQPIVTLINPDDLWVRADVEESYIDGIRLGDKLKVTFQSGAESEGTVFYRGVDADYATQRDVSRTKRDIKTFEIRLRCDNSDRRLAVGMTAYITLPINYP